MIGIGSLRGGLERRVRQWRSGAAAVASRRAAGARVGPIGLYCGPDTMHLVQLARSGGGLRVRAAAAVPLPDAVGSSEAPPNVLRAPVRSALRGRAFRGRRVVAALDAPDVKLMVLDCASADDVGEPAAILKLVEERFDEPTDELVIDYLPIRALGEKKGQRSALVAVARRDVVVARLECLRLAGLEIEALEIAPVATRRLVAALGSTGSEENALVLYAGRDRGHLIVLWGRRLVLYREIDFGADAAVERLAKALDLAPGEAAALLNQHGVMSPASGEASKDAAASHEVAETIGEILKPSFYQLADQLNRAMIYTASKARGAAPDRAYLLGAFASWPRADRLLEALGPLPVRSLDPAMAIGGEAAAAPEGRADAALATGLALRGMVDDG